MKIMEQHNFQHFVMKKRLLSHLFSFLIIFIYFSFILIIGFYPEMLAKKVGKGSMTLGVLFGLVIIIFSILLTFLYTLISNKYIDDIQNKVNNE